MSASKAKQLSAIFRSAAQKTSKKNSETKATTATAQKIEIVNNKLIPSLGSSLRNTSKSGLTGKLPKKPGARVLSKAAASSAKSGKSVVVSSSSCETPSRGLEESEKELLSKISSIICGGSRTISESCNLPTSEAPNDGISDENLLDIPWFSKTSYTTMSQRRKELSRERKEKWIFKNTQNHRFNRLVTMCGQTLGAKKTLEVLGKLGRETGLKEYSALIGLCMEYAKTSKDEETALDHIHDAYQLFKQMREQGFQVEEETYGPFLMYLIDMGMVEEFHFFSSVIKGENADAYSRLGYYEMLLWVRINNKDKVQELCNSIGVENDGDNFNITENYLLALCDKDRKEELVQLLDSVDVTRVSSLEFVSSIFKSLGRLLLENFAEKFILAFKTSETEAENISYFICNYAISMPNLAVEDVILNFNDLHKKHDVIPSYKSYEKLVTYCCDSLKVHAALSVIDQSCQIGLPIPIELFHPILQAVEENCELDLVYPIYDFICSHNLKPNGETFRSMINLCVKMKDFEGAYKMLTDLEKMKMRPTANIYNSILAGYFREKNVHGALMVLDQMKSADVKPDSQTFSYLISNCESDEDIIKYHEELRNAGVQVTKHVFMALINAYVNCGEFEKAKQVVMEQGIPVKSINEVKSVLVSALASSGHVPDAIKIYEEIKEVGGLLEPKAIISLIENLQCEGELNRLLQLLGELTDLDFWLDGCRRIISYCVQYKHLSSAIDLLKQLKDKDATFIDVVLDQAFCQISEKEPPVLDVGLDLLTALKEELNVHPSRTGLDFLLSACVSAKDPLHAWSIWNEYEKAGLPFNVLTFLRMYQVLVASGEHKSAKDMLKRIHKDDPHVRCIIKASGETFSDSICKKSKKLGQK